MKDQPVIRERVTENGETNSIFAAIYARTSSTSQDYGYSLTEQVKQCISQCQSLGWDITFVYRDEAESGKDTDRPMFQKMLRRAECNTFDVVVFWKLDRFSRSLMHAVQLEADLRQHDVALYSVTEQIDTTSATGRFNFRNLASAAEFERDMIRQRTEMSLNGMAEENKWPNDTPPLGYKITSDRKLQVIDGEREVVNEIFDLYIELRSMPAVSDKLNQRGISTQEGGEWTPRAVGDILRNEIYIGEYELGDISKHVPEYQIIEEETFREVTEIRMRFQTNDASRPEMSDPRKEEMVDNMRQMYTEFIQERSKTDVL